MVKEREGLGISCCRVIPGFSREPKGGCLERKKKKKKKEAILTESPERETKRKKESRVEVFRVE